MKKSKILSLLLSVSLLTSLVIPGALALPTRAIDGQDNSGMVISKTAEADGNGGYKITLEAYATGEKIITETKKDVPTDIVLVLDQSGSMDEKMSTYDFRKYTDRNNAYFYSVRHNGASSPNLYYKLDDGSYASVSVTIQEGGLTHTKISNGRNNQSGNNKQYTNLWENRNNLYAKVNGEYQKVTVTQETEGFIFTTTYYVYTLPDNTEIARSEGWNNTPTINRTDDNALYLASVDENQNIYTYTYTDKDDVTHTIGSSTGASTKPTDFTLYERYQSGTVTRLKALVTAVTNFSNNVAKKAAGPDGDLSTTEDNVNHRIAVVGFASGSYYGNTNYNYGNTEVFVGANQYKYGTSAQGVYTRAFQDMNTTQGQSNVSASINALDANGGTLIDLGVEMANGILNANPVPAGEKRNRVIVVFTDGQPGWSGYDEDVAQSAIDEAKKAKDDGVTVYTVGIFSGADATSGGNANGTTEQKSNWFMQNLSSNNGKPQNPSYYLSASDANTLNNIFQQISDQIESGGSTATLSSETVIKDIISPYFTLPEGATAADITLETYHCTGKNGDVYTWSKNETAMGAEAAISGDQVSVTGFDFKDNYVGTVTEANGSVSYRGDKLVISFTVTPKAGFLGGNNVETNTRAGVYENASSTDPVLTFEKPQVNVPIGDVAVSAADQNVYLLTDVTGASLKAGTTVTVGGVSLDLDPTANNFGLEAWQNKFVSIDVKLLDSSGNEITDFTGLTDDASYTVSVTVSSKTDGQNASGDPAVAKSGSGGANIYVYKPYIVFQDSSINAGDTPNYGTDNFVSSEFAWKHGNDTAPASMGAAPTLTYTYAPAAAPLSAETEVKVSVAMNVTAANPQGVDVTRYVSFHRNRCAADNGCSFVGGDVSVTDDRVNFIVHIKTFDLTITKVGTQTIDHDGSAERQSYIFHVTGPNGFKMDVVICGDGSKTIKNLPVGNYTITEDDNWSWRYDADASSYSVTAASISQGKATVTVENTRTNPYWLNGGNYAHNVFGN